ncbi:glycosyltransferase family 39 protein [Streptomyces sp. NPDC059564]|uniref:glycosyltransferase family 39 protein n=1 Tax=Streptomyces sp. NPDC059564 TaxID=3346865 RepID=UPI00368BD23D
MSLHAPSHTVRPSGAGRERLWTALLLLLPGAVSLALISRGIGGRQLWRDEHATWWAATLSFGDLGTLIRGIDVVFTPYYVLMHLWVSVAGESATAMRVPGALAMAAAPGLLALLGRRLFTRQVGLVAGLAFAVVPAVTRYGQEVRPYAFAVAAVLLSTLLLVRALQRPGFEVWVAYTLSVPLVGWSHLASLAVLAPHLVLVVQARRAGDRIVGRAYAAAGILGLCFVLPMAASGAGQSAQIAWNNPGVDDLLHFPENLFGSWAVAAPVMVLGLTGLCFTGRRAPALGLWVALPPVVTFATAAQLHLFRPRYLFFTAPTWVLLAAVALCRIAGPVTGPSARTAGGRTAGAGTAGAGTAGAGTARARMPGAARRVLGRAVAVAAVGGLAFQALPGSDADRGPAGLAHPAGAGFLRRRRVPPAADVPGRHGAAVAGVHLPGPRRAVHRHARGDRGADPEGVRGRPDRAAGLRTGPAAGAGRRGREAQGERRGDPQGPHLTSGPAGRSRRRPPAGVVAAGLPVGGGAGREQQSCREQGAEESETDPLGCFHG